MFLLQAVATVEEPQESEVLVDQVVVEMLRQALKLLTLALEMILQHVLLMEQLKELMAALVE